MKNKMKDNIKEFYNKPKNYRIELVIHDGNWYTKEKWAKIARVSVSDIEKYIDSVDYLIKTNDSYRCNYDEIIRWYKSKKLNITAELIPKNFPPKLWDGKTEVEHFLESPKTEVSTMLVEYKGPNNELYEAIINELRYYGYLLSTKNNKIKVYCISPELIKHKVIQIVPKNEIEHFNFRSREDFYLRFLIDINENYLEKALEFYNWYAYTLLKPQMETIRIFLETNEAIYSKITEWVLTAVQKYDETQSVPFSGYLANVLRSWPYDLPSEEYGKQLSAFHRNRQKLIKECNKKNEPVPEARELAEILGITYEEYLEFDFEYNNWRKKKFAEEIVFDKNKGNEKKAYNLMSKKTTEDLDQSYNFSKMVLRLFKETKDAKSVYALLTNDLDNIDSSFKEGLYNATQKKNI